MNYKAGLYLLRGEEACRAEIAKLLQAKFKDLGFTDLQIGGINPQRVLIHSNWFSFTVIVHFTSDLNHYEVQGMLAGCLAFFSLSYVNLVPREIARVKEEYVPFEMKGYIRLKTIYYVDGSAENRIKTFGGWEKTQKDVSKISWVRFYTKDELVF